MDEGGCPLGCLYKVGLDRILQEDGDSTSDA